MIPLKHELAYKYSDSIGDESGKSFKDFISGYDACEEKLKYENEVDRINLVAMTLERDEFDEANKNLVAQCRYMTAEMTGWKERWESAVIDGDLLRTKNEELQECYELEQEQNILLVERVKILEEWLLDYRESLTTHRLFHCEEKIKAINELLHGND